MGGRSSLDARTISIHGSTCNCQLRCSIAVELHMMGKVFGLSCE